MIELSSNNKQPALPAMTAGRGLNSGQHRSSLKVIHVDIENFFFEAVRTFYCWRETQVAERYIVVTACFRHINQLMGLLFLFQHDKLKLYLDKYILKLFEHF